MEASKLQRSKRERFGPADEVCYLDYGDYVGMYIFQNTSNYTLNGHSLLNIGYT